ncbi:uncharacterized protein LOC110809924 isoform X3 [Carica papaya]|uniref:uncharacterized protein LOC110809924 isoform X3 n=1 Tax=Carica papaya TaxID=3649 RepID=UPI000B8CEF14|nr:uncharacterized protein LOC110809924 isoform X3 [Carica papaya]
MKRKRVPRKKKLVKKAAEVDQNEEAFLDFVNQNNEEAFHEVQGIEEPLQENQNNMEPHQEKQNNLESSQKSQNSLKTFSQNQNDMEPHQEKQNNLESSQKSQNSLKTFSQNQNDMEPRQRNPNNMENNQTNKNNVEPHKRNLNNMEPYQGNQSDVEPYQRNWNSMEPHQRSRKSMEPHQRNQNNMDPYQRNLNNMEPHKRNLNNMEPYQGNQNDVEPHQRNWKNMEPHQRSRKSTEPHQRNQNNMDPYQRNLNNMEPYQGNQSDVESYQINWSNMEPHQRSRKSMEPYQRNQNNMDHYQRNLNNMEPHQRNLNSKDPYSRNVNNEGPYLRNLNNMEPYRETLNNEATYRKSFINERTYRKNRNKEGKKMAVSISDDEYDVSESESDSGLSPLLSSSSSSKSDESYDVLGSSSSDDSWIDKKLRKSIRGRRKAKRKKEKLLKKSTQVKGQSLRGLSSLSTKIKKSKISHHDPQYNKKELKTAFLVIKKVMKMDEAYPFNAPVDPIAQGIPDYFDIVDIPMDFGTIRSNLQNGTKYMNSEDVFNDVEYIWNNCCKYSNEGDYTLHLMKRVRKKFMKYWTAAGLNCKQRRKISGSTNHNFNLTSQDKLASSQRHRLPTANRDQQFQAHQPLASTVQPQFSQLPPSNNQPYQLQQPQPSTNQPQLSCMQVDVEGRAHIRSRIDVSILQKRRMCSRQVVSTVNGSSQSQLQQPRIDGQTFHLQQPQQSTSQPHLCQIHTGRDLAISCKEGCTMNCGKYVPWCLKDSMHYNCTQILAQEPPLQQESPASAGQPLSQMPQANTVTGPALNLGRSLQRSSLEPAAQSPNQQPLDPLQSQLEQVAEDNHGPHGSKQLPQKRKKGGRGPTRCLFLKDLPEGERILVPFNKIGQPVGREASKLSSFLGNIARNGHIAPLNYISWRHLPDTIKEDIWQHVQSKFEIEPIGKAWVMKSVATKWRDWKAELKACHYYPNKTDEERLKDINPRVVPDQWPFLVCYWSSEKEKIRSAKNRANRYKQKGVHAMGTKSFARIREEERAKRPDGKEPTRAELYILTHTRKDGQPVDETAAEAIAKLQEHTTQRKTTEGSYSDERDTFFEVMGEEKRNHVRTYGLGPTPADIWGTTPKRCDHVRVACEVKKLTNQEVSKMLDKMEALEQKYSSMEAQIAKINSSMQILLEKVGATSANLETKQVPPDSNAAADIRHQRLNSSSSSHAVASQEATTHAHVDVED